MITRDSIQEYLEIRPPSQPISIQYEDRLGSIVDLVEILDGTPKKSSMNTIPFSPEMRALAHVMIHNLYPVTNLTTLLARRTKFLYDLFTHQKIDIFGHIFHLLKKCIEKQHSRTVIPFPSLIIGLIAKTKLKFSSGLTVISRDYPLVNTQSPEAQPTSKVPRQVCIRYHRIMLRMRVKIRRRRLIDLPLP